MKKLPEDKVKDVLAHLRAAQYELSEMRDNVAAHFENCEENSTTTEAIIETDAWLAESNSALIKMIDSLDEIRHNDLSPFSSTIR